MSFPAPLEFIVHCLLEEMQLELLDRRLLTTSFSAPAVTMHPRLELTVALVPDFRVANVWPSALSPQSVTTQDGVPAPTDPTAYPMTRGIPERFSSGLASKFA